MNKRVLIITNLFADPFGPTRATFNQQQFGRLSEQMNVRIMVPVSWVPVVRNPLAYWRLKQETQARWPQADYVIFWYLPVVGRGLHPLWLFLSLVLQRFPTLFLRRWDCIFGSWGFPDGVVAAVLGLLTRTPLVIKVHGSDINIFTQKWAHRVQIRWALNRARAIVSVSKALDMRMTEIGVVPGRTTVLYNGVDPQRFHPVDSVQARQRHGFGLGDEVILYIGNILSTKGCGDLLEAFGRLAVKRPQSRLVYVGDGGMRKALEARAAALGLQDRVRFAGRVAHTELVSWFACASVFCLPSHAEGVPNVVLEAMACGTPVVATDVGGIGEILPDFAGHLVPVQDVPTLAATIDKTLASAWDRERIVAYMKPFDWGVNVRALKGLIEGVRA